MLRRCIFSVRRLPQSNDPNYQAEMTRLYEDFNAEYTEKYRKEMRELGKTLSPESLEKIDLVLYHMLNMSRIEKKLLSHIVRKKANPEIFWPVFIRKGQPIPNYDSSDPVRALGFEGFPEEYLKNLLKGNVKGEGKAEETQTAEKTIFNLVMKGFDPATKVKLIKAFKDITGHGLKESKELIEKSATEPIVLYTNVSKESHSETFQTLKDLGANVEFE